MKIGNLIDMRQNFEKILKSELLTMDVYFQNYLWDGFSDPEDSKFITPDDFDAIQALTDKIEHICINIGSPCSVKPMLESIISRKIKHWSGYTLFLGDSTIKKGMQLKTKNQRNMCKKATEYEYQKSGIVSGHFRWNNRGYMLSRRATNLLEIYYLENFTK